MIYMVVVLFVALFVCYLFVKFTNAEIKRAIQTEKWGRVYFILFACLATLFFVSMS
jgi:hypothetical protein